MTGGCHNISCIVVSLRDIGNKLLFTLAFMNSYSSMGIGIDDFISRNVDNYNDVRNRSMTSNKTASRTISMSLSKTSVNYATRMEQFNDISDKVKTRDPINISQLSYAKPKEIQVNRITNHENRTCLQQDIENIPALNSTLLQCVNNDVINIQLPYDPNTPMKSELWNGSFYSISLHGSLMYLTSDAKNIKEFLNSITRYISNKQIDPK